MISRDRSGIYAEAARRGAPQAMQVADRWHLLKNLTAAIERFFLAKTGPLKLALGKATSETMRASVSSVTSSEALIEETDTRKREEGSGKRPPEPYTNLPPQVAAERKQRLAAQVRNYHKVQALSTKQLPITAIARRVGISTKTVRRYLQMPEPPTSKKPNRSYGDILAVHKAYLIQRWNEGCHSGRQLARGLVMLAPEKAPSVATVSRFTKLLRRGELTNNTPYQPLLLEDFSRKTRPLTSYQAALVMSLKPTQRKRWQQEYLERLCVLDEEIATTHSQVLAFTTMMRRRKGQQLDVWLEQALANEVAPLHNFAKGLQADYAAVRVGLTYQYSNGQVEGQNNRLKYLKRQMFGRASFNLLRARVLHRPSKSALLDLVEKLAS